MGKLAVDDILKTIESGNIPAAVEYVASLPPDEVKPFLDRIGSLKSDQAARLLTALYPTVGQKDLKKLIKKMLFHLKTQGVRVEEPAAPGEPVLKKIQTTKEQIAFASNYDHEDIRVLLLAFELRKKQFIFTHATQRFAEGLVDMMSAPMDRQGLDSLTNDYRARTRRPMVLVEISPLYATYLLEEASRQSGRQIEEIRGLKRLTADFTGDVRNPADIHKLQSRGSLPETSWQQVLAHEMFEPFTLQWKDMEKDRRDYDSIVHPQIVVPPHIVEDKKGAYLRELAESEKIQALRPLLLRMFEDYAYLLFRLGEYNGYSALLAALQSTETFDPVIRFLLRKSLDQKQKEEEQQAQQQPGLIVNPYRQKP